MEYLNSASMSPAIFSILPERGAAKGVNYASLVGALVEAVKE